MTTEWAAKVLADVPRHSLDFCDRMEIDKDGVWMHEDAALDAIAKLADGGGLVDRATAALEGVTDGPWAVECKYGTTRLLMGNEVAMCDEKYYPWTPENDKDWHFIAFARQWVPEAADRIAALTAQVGELEGAQIVNQNAIRMQKTKREAAEAESAALRAKLARIASAWPIVRDADCSGGTLASAMDEIEAAISDGAADEATEASAALAEFHAKGGRTLDEIARDIPAAIADGGKDA